MIASLQTVQDERGQQIWLGPKLGAGGEGDVFSVEGNAKLTVKLYHKIPDAEKAAKLRTMVQTGSRELGTFCCWPQSIIQSNNGAIRGFVMRRLEPGYKPVLQLYSPVNRKKTFPEADYSFIVHAAMNTATAFAAVHEAGHVIGDVNQKNILVDSKALVALIDCDSFQVADSTGKIFTCEVGAAGYTPPELQGKLFKRILRSTHHDNFGLAVLIFHLLFMGRHPFAGKYIGVGSPPQLNDAIANYLFAYASNAGLLLRIVPPPSSLPITFFPTEIMSLFEYAFSEGCEALRPSAEQWRLALSRLKDDLKACSKNVRHKFPRQTLGGCPWCDFDRKGTAYFLSSNTSANGPTITIKAELVQEIQRLLGEIHSVNSSIASGMVAVKSLNSPIALGMEAEASLNANQYRASSLLPEDLKLSTCISNFASLVGWSCDKVFLADVLLVVWRTSLGRGSSGYSRDRKRLKNLQKRLAAELDQVKAQLPGVIGESDHHAIKQADDLLNEYSSLQGDLNEKLNWIGGNVLAVQRRTYLQSFPIEGFLAPGVWNRQKATLRSFGIETAWDVSYDRIVVLPGFGPTLSSAVVGWKQHLLRRFRPDSNEPVPQSELKAVVASYNQHARELELELRDCRSNLVNIHQRLTDHCRAVKRMHQLQKSLAQTNADLELLDNSIAAATVADFGGKYLDRPR